MARKKTKNKSSASKIKSNSVSKIKNRPKIQPTSKRWHATPLKGSFMALSMIGFLITIYLIYPKSSNYGIAFMIVFIAMFIAALISMTKAPVIE